MREERIAYADALRLLAIGAVVGRHLGVATNLPFAGGRADAWLGIWGVDCFFVLSGFLLSRSFLAAILGRAEFPSLREYFLRRFLRIYPLYFAALLVSTLVAGAAGKAPSFGDVVAHLTLMQGFFPRFVTTLNGPLWTMSVDAQFYVALPFVSLALVSLARNRPESARVRLVWFALGTLAAAGLAERFVAFTLLGPHIANWDDVTVAGRNVLGVGADFALGAALALVALLNPTPAGPKLRYAASLALGIALLVALERRPVPAAHDSGVLFWTFADLVGGCSAAALLYGAVRGRFAWLARWSSSGPVLWGARLAYAVYLFHIVIVDIAAGSFRNAFGAEPGALAFALSVVPPIVAVAYVAHRFIERPGLLLRDRHREPAAA